MVSPWLSYAPSLCFPEAEGKMQRVMDVIRAVRTAFRNECAAPRKAVPLCRFSPYRDVYEEARPIITKLPYASDMEVGDAFEIAGAVTVVTNDAKVYVPMEELVDKVAETRGCKGTGFRGKAARISQREAFQRDLHGEGPV